MKEMTLNETPVRTARNFQINNIKLKDIDYNVNLGNFENTKINKLGSDVNIDEKVKDHLLKYGVGKELDKEIEEKANCKKRIVIKENAREEIAIIHDFDANNLNLVDKIEVIAEENSKTNLAITYDSQDESVCYHNGKITVAAKKKAEIKLFVFNFLNTKSTHFLSIEGKVEEEAKIHLILIDLGAKISISNCYLDIERISSKK